ncbi:MAG TPA: hypothetical protein VE175_15180 [Woeseiaceae bacterium]|jgi:hypothetical protein|nr:hypothetical protein [Woeseiaceae bacterium]
MPANSPRLKDLRRNLLNPGWLAFVWFGLTAGISLLETPVKFTAPTITRRVALDVGRVVFTALNRAELILLILLLILVRVSGRSRQLFAASAGLVLILLTQTLWLLPELSARTQSIVNGIEPGASIVHGAYVGLELAKLLLLLYIGFRAWVTPAPTH